MLRACLSRSYTACDLGTQPPPLLARAATPLELPGSSHRTLATSHPPVHLLHANAQDEYHGCIRNDMMLMMDE
jgi:hypothetical protein